MRGPKLEPEPRVLSSRAWLEAFGREMSGWGPGHCGSELVQVSSVSLEQGAGLGRAGSGEG